MESLGHEKESKKEMGDVGRTCGGGGTPLYGGSSNLAIAH